MYVHAYLELYTAKRIYLPEPRAAAAPHDRSTGEHLFPVGNGRRLQA